ncbi:hypothetical protein ACFQ48_19370 [Hymenobacter caeli]|uniref:ATP-binding protein n=1 Tax=Hymenobacter caeli TaxID=2735894 RepID=A0ABX2FVA2_9BACT|nr:hypothetical protein [Hymenobacter caeli]NRT21120.1 hypothetical protein [Hymenobacter caeli]
MTTLSSLIQLSTAFSAEIDLSTDFCYNLTAPDQKIEGYLPNRSSRRVMKAILDTISPGTDHKVHLIQASYGTGKSYLLLMLAHLLGNNDTEVLATFLHKIADKEAQIKDGLTAKLTALTERDDKFLVVIPNYGETDFRHALLKGLIVALDKQGLSRPPTMYQRAAEVLEGWEVSNEEGYKKFAKKLSGIRIEDFIGLLRDLDAPTYQSFKTYFREIVQNSFDESDVADVYTVYAETAKSIAAQGYRGIVVLYDEFGDMLNRMINSPEGSGLAVQKFVEGVKRAGNGANILFLAATHQNPSSLQEDKKQDISKIIGRFDTHLLGATKDTLDGSSDDVEITDATEIMGTVFIRPADTKPQLDALLKAEDYASNATDLVRKQGLYGKQTAEWIGHNVVENLFPLHPLTARLLPKFSNEFAQNTRTMFNFLSPSQLEVGGLQHFLKTQPLTDSGGWPTLFTPDRLFDFFEANLKEVKFGINLLDDYKTAAAKVTGEIDAERLLRNVLIMKAVRDKRLAPRREMLFWAQNWPVTRTAEFNALLDGLVSKEWLEQNPTDHTYDFPSSGALSVGNVVKEEEANLAGFKLGTCIGIWNSLEPRPALESAEQTERYGALRRYEVVPIYQASDPREKLEKLAEYYKGQAENWSTTGYVFPLIADNSDAIKQLVQGVVANKAALPYVFYAQPRDPLFFAEPLKKTVKYEALRIAMQRDDIVNNPARKEKVSEQLRTVEAELRNIIKRLFEPINWEWFYADDKTARDFTNIRSFNNWFDEKVDERFSEVPTIKDEALWFVKRTVRASDRDRAFAIIYNAEPNKIPLDSTGNAPEERILRNFFQKLTLSKQKSSEKSIQYGDITSPDSGTPEAAIFKHFDKVLKGKDSGAPAPELFTPLLQAPYGLSEHLIKFFFGCYVRFHSLQITLFQRGMFKEKNAELFKELFKKPVDFKVRRVDMSSKEESYFKDLRDLFDKRTANSFGEIARQLQGIQLSALQKTLISQQGGEVKNFFEAVAELGRQAIIPEPEARALFLETLPNSLVGAASQEAFEDDPANKPKLLDKLRTFRQFPLDADKRFRLETLQLLAKEVFGETIINKDEILGVTQRWFKSLSAAQRMASFANPRIAAWVNLIKNGPMGKDILSWYFSELTDTPLNDWEGNLHVRQSKYVQEFQGYKKSVEDFIIDPIKVLQHIAREVFEVPVSECPTEAAFGTMFKAWWTSLGQLKQTHNYPDTAAKWLLDNIDSTAPTTALYLDAIPRRWIEKGSLPSIIPTKWEEWTETHVAAVAAEYRRCYNVINAWQPPVTEEEFFTGVSQVFGLAGITCIEALNKGILSEWFTNLPARTREADWLNKTSDDALLLNQLLSETSLYSLLTQTLPTRWALPSLKDISAEELPQFLKKVENLKGSVEQYRRPLLEVVAAFDRKKKYGHETEYLSSLYDNLRSQEAFTVKADGDETLLTDSLARLMLNRARSKASLGKLIEEVAAYLGLPIDNHIWDKDQQKEFVSNWNKAISTIQAWSFPEDRKLDDARVELSSFIQEFCDTKGLTSTQRCKLLNDLLNELVPSAQVL